MLCNAPQKDPVHLWIREWVLPDDPGLIGCIIVPQHLVNYMPAWTYTDAMVFVAPGMPGPNFIELLNTKIHLACNFCLDKTFHVIFRISKQQLNTSNKLYATIRNFVGYPFFIKEEISC